MTTTTAAATPSVDDRPGSEQVQSNKEQQKAGARALKDLVRPVAGRLATGRVLAVLSAIFAVVPYVALVHIGDLLLTAHRTGAAVDGEQVRRWIQILLVAFALRLGLYFAALLVTHFADIKFGHVVQLRLVQRFSRVRLAWFTSTNSGRVRKALQDDITTVHHLIAHQPVEGASATVMPVALMVYAFVIDWRLGLLSIATIPFYAAAMAMSMRGMGEKTVEMDQRLSTVSARMVEFVTGITVVKAFGRVGRAHRSYQQAADEFYEFYVAWVRPLTRVSGIGMSLLAVPLILLINIGVGSVLVHHGVVSAADVLATSLIALLVPFAIETLMVATWSKQIAGAAALRLVELVQTPVLPAGGDPGHAQSSSYDVVFDHVSYSYDDGPDAQLAVDDVSFTLGHGSVTALIGPSGSGKSTIATLLARFDDPQSGTITIAGVPIAQMSDLYTKVGFVLQDPQLLGISIRDNITLGRPDATDEQVREAAGAARILDDVLALPDGLDTVYGGECGLSGGQEQRIAIARALLVDAPVLILDEATALTDPESEHEVQQGLSALARGRTVLVIAHRPEVIKGVDQIIVVDAGRVRAAGTHDELLDDPTYARLWQVTGAEARTADSDTEGIVR